MNCFVIRESDEVIQKRKEKARARRNFLNNKIMIWSIFTGYVMGVTPRVFDYANSFRLHPGIGGEIFLPFLPFILYPVYNKICNLIWKKVKQKIEG